MTGHGQVRRVVLRSGSETHHEITATSCSLDFRNNDLATIGMNARMLSHRGDSRVFPANTLPAFAAALDQGFAGFELDVRLTLDGVAVVSHDDGLAVATDCKGSVARTDSRILRNCRAVRTPLLPESRFLARRARVPAPVPTLSEALDRFIADPRAAQIVVDIKVGGDRRLIAALEAALPPCNGSGCEATERRLTFISQDSADTALLQTAFPQAHIALESNRTVSGLIDEPDGDHWANPAIDTYSLSFNSLFDWRLKVVKLLRGENLTPMRRFRAFYERNLAQARPRRLLGWTIANRAGVRALWDFAFADILTDLTYAQVVRYLMEARPPEAAAREFAAGR